MSRRVVVLAFALLVLGGQGQASAAPPDQPVPTIPLPAEIPTVQLPADVPALHLPADVPPIQLPAPIPPGLL
jgi:hypothetical protein